MTTATDTYSLGVLLYEILCGRRPYKLTTAALGQIEAQLVHSSPPRPSTAVIRDLAADGSTETVAELAQRRRSAPQRLATPDFGVTWTTS